MNNRLSNEELTKLFHKYLPLYLKNSKTTLALINKDKSIPPLELDAIKGLLLDYKKESSLDSKKCKKRLQDSKDLIKDKIKKQNRKQILADTDDNSDYLDKSKGHFEHEGSLDDAYDAYNEYKQDLMNYSELTERLQKINANL